MLLIVITLFVSLISYFTYRSLKLFFISNKLETNKNLKNHIFLQIFTCNNIFVYVLYNKIDVTRLILIVLLMQMLIIIGVKDIYTKIIKNKDLYKYLIIVLFIFVYNLISLRISLENTIINCILAICLAICLYMFTNKQIGGGDIKLLIITGLFMNMDEIMIVVFVASIMALLIYLYKYIIERKCINEMSFGNYLGAAIGILLMLKRW